MAYPEVFFWLPGVRSVRLSITAVVAAPTGRWPFNRDYIVTGAAGPLNSQMREGRPS